MLKYKPNESWDIPTINKNVEHNSMPRKCDNNTLADARVCKIHKSVSVYVCIFLFF